MAEPRQKRPLNASYLAGLSPPPQHAKSARRHSRVATASASSASSRSPPASKAGGPFGSAAGARLAPQRHRVVPLGDVTGPSGDSIERYAELMSQIDSQHPPPGQRAKATKTRRRRPLTEAAKLQRNWALLSGLTAQLDKASGPGMPSSMPEEETTATTASASATSTEGPSFAWARTFRLEAACTTGVAMAASGKAASGSKPEQVLQHAVTFVHPAETLPAALRNSLSRCRTAADAAHSAQRLDGSLTLHQPREAAAEADDLFMSSSARREARSDDSAAAFLFERRRRWAAAFRSLLRLLRGGQCPFFYVVDVDSTVALFVAGSPPLAMLSRSRKGLRSQLQRCMVAFERPLDGPSREEEETPQAAAELQDELLAYSKSSAVPLQRSNSTSEDLARSPLLVRGEQSVAGLHSVLLNRVLKRAGAHAEPTLRSPVLFDHAVGVPPAVRVGSRLELRGALLPHQVGPLARALFEAGPRDHSLALRLQVEGDTDVFNEMMARAVGRREVSSATTIKVGATGIEQCS